MNVVSILWVLSPLPLALILAPVCRRVAIRLGLVDRPRADRFGLATTPKLGGLVIALALLPAALRIASDPLVAATGAGFGVALAGGLADDAYALSPRVKLPLQLLASSVSVGLLALALPPGGVLEDAPIALLVSAAIVWVTAFQNAVNFLDNMDGIVGGIVAIGLTALALLLPAPLRELALAIAAACIGFLRWNMARPSRLYLGDAGALPLGHAIGFLALVAIWRSETIGAAAAPIIALLVPVLDITFVTVLRLAAGRSPALGGRDHTTHRLYARFGSVEAARRLTWAAAALLGAMALAVTRFGAVAALGASAAALGAGVVAAGYLSRIPAPGPHGVRD